MGNYHVQKTLIGIPVMKQKLPIQTSHLSLLIHLLLLLMARLLKLLF